MFTTFFCCLSYFPFFVDVVVSLLFLLFLLFLFVLVFIYYFATRSTLFSQAGLLVKFPIFLQKGRFGIFRMSTVKKPFPRRVMQSWDTYWGAGGADTLGGFKGWSWLLGCVTDTAIIQHLRSSKPEPVEQQECSPCVKGHCCTKVMDNANKPGEACRALPRKEQGVTRLPVLSKPALHCILLVRTWHSVYTVWPSAVLQKGRELWSFPRLCPTHPEPANLLSPCLGPCGGAADCWHIGNHIKSSLTGFIFFYILQLSRGRETTW